VAHARAIAEVTVDNPHAAGRLDRFAFQRDWTHKPLSQDDELYGGALGQGTLHDGTEYVPGVGLKPMARGGQGDMAAADWTVLAGSWRVTTPAVTSPRTAWLDYYKSGPQKVGRIESVNPFGLNVGLGIIRDALPNDTADYPRYVAVCFNATTAQSTYRSTAFVFPYGMKSQKHPYVLDRLASGSGDGEIVAHWEMTGNHATKLDKDTRLEFLFFEVLDGRWVVRHSDFPKPFIYQPYERTDPRFVPGAFAAGTIRITVYGHSAMIYCAPLTYDTEAQAQAQPYQDLADTLYSDMSNEALATWHTHGWRPDALWTTSVEGTHSVGLGYAPKTTFTWAGAGSPTNCPVCYVSTLDLQTTWATPVSAPDVLSGQKVVKSLEYTINNKGRGQTCSVVVDDPAGTKAALYKGQNNTKINVGWDDVVPVQKFHGYLGERPTIKRAAEDVGRTRYVLDLQDPVDARLSAKFMIDRSAAGFEHFALWVWRTLHDAGEPAAYLTDILALSAGTLVDIIIPGSYGGKKLAHDFESTVSVPDALDKVCNALGYTWGWNAETSQWFLRPVQQLYTAPATWTMDDDTTIADEVQWEIDHLRSKHEFRNYLYMIAQTSSGAESCRLWLDANSHKRASASNFIGCDLWEVVKEQDLWSGLAKGQAKWAELQGFPSTLKWSMRGHTDLGPNDTVKVQVTKMGLTTDAIYRVAEEHGELPEDSLQWRATYTADWVQ
jgi:hypothetical protein